MDINFSSMKTEELIDYIKKQKKLLKDKIKILAHHYQNIEIVKLADIVGDSYKLAVEGSRSTADFLVFCGVKFMTEGAKVLCGDNQKVIMPDLKAGCPMADMIDLNSSREVYNKLTGVYGRDIAPVVYVNSNLDVKSFCGEKGGSTCTSSNAEKILNWYLKKGKAVFFSPDYNLGINTAGLLNIKEKNIVKVKKDLTFESEKNIKEAKLFLWDGYCIVHKIFTPHNITALREKYKDIKIIVHPECNKDVVEMSDISGSTEKILTTVSNSEKGSIWGVGTEFNFVSRLESTLEDIKVLPLRESRCRNMEEITLPDLALSLQSVSDYLDGKGALRFEIEIKDEYKENARKALQKMIDIVEEK